MRKALGVLLMFGITQIAGCATRYVELPYPPEEQVNMSSPATQTTASAPRTHQVILAVNDTREIRDRVGNFSDGFGMETGSVLTEDNIEVWVFDAILFELNRLGYHVLDHRGSQSDASADRLTVEVQKVYCDVAFIYDGEVSLQATLVRVGEEPLMTESETKVSSGLNWVKSGSAVGESLAQALQTAIRDVLYDLGFTN